MAPRHLPQRDTRLKREVAVKILPEFARGMVRRCRTEPRMRRIRPSLIACALLVTACSGMPSAPSAPATSVAGPAVPSPGPPVASLAVEAFTVIGSRHDDSLNGEWFEFQPALRLSETSGKSGAWVTSINFHLDDIGPAGAVPPWGVKKRVDAGATRDMIGPDVYGDYEFSISGHTDAQRVSVVISFTDDQGRSGSVTAVATVSH
jgi:hypothetical protein